MPVPYTDDDTKRGTVIVGKRNHFWHTLCIECGEGSLYEYKHRAYDAADSHRCEAKHPKLPRLFSS